MVGLLGTLRRNVASYLAGLVRQWDEFWFQPEDPLALGFLRILTGAMLIYTHLVWGIKLEAFLGPNGFQDPLLVKVLEPDSTAWTLWWLVPDAYMGAAHWSCIVVLVLYTLGLWTTVTKWAAPLITISYANRAPNANFGLDQINAMLAIYLALGPCGARLSLDRVWRVYRHGVRSLQEQQCWSILPILPSSSARLVTRLIQVHMCVVYFFAGVSKLKGDAWWNGEAIWMALSNAEYQTTDMTWLAWYPWVSDVATHSTTLWEMTFWVLVWRPTWRPIVLFVGASMHVGIGVCLGMWTFGLVMIFTYVTYIPPETLRRVGHWLAGALSVAAPVSLTIPQGSGWRLRWVAWRKATDLRNRIELVASEPLLNASDRKTLLVVPAPLSFITSAEWWAAHKHSITSWPFADCDRMDIRRPRIIIVHAVLDTLTTLQNYFLSKGFDCRAVSSLSATCAALFDRPTDALLLMSQSSLEVDEILLFRNILSQASAHAPVSVTVLPKFLHDHRCESSTEHLIVVGSATLRELRTELTRALLERTCTEEEAMALAGTLGSRSPSSASNSLGPAPSIQGSLRLFKGGYPTAGSVGESFIPSPNDRLRQ